MSGSLRFAGTSLTLLGVVLLSFVLHVTAIGQMRHARAQQTMFADFRVDLAEATAPVGQAGSDNKPLALGRPVGVLDIPALGISEVVVEGTTSGALRDGPGHRRDTVLPGQRGSSVVMGRRAAFGGPFADLPRLRAGDAIRVVTGQGESQYQVRGVRRPGDPTPPPLDPDAGRLTLVTADGRPFMPADVVYVDADLRSAPQQAPSKLFGSAQLPEAEKAMAAEGGAWVPVVLWGQLLLIGAAAVTWATVRWGRRQAWVAGVPVLTVLGATVADQVLRLLPNLL